MALMLVLTSGAQALHAALFVAQKHENRHEIDLLEEQWRNAVITSNVKAMDALLADDYTAITPSGALQTRDDALQNLRSGKVHVISITVSDRKVRFYGNTAVVTSMSNIHAVTPDGPIEGNYRYMRVYIRNAQGKWKIVSFEASRIREPGPHRHDELH